MNLLKRPSAWIPLALTGGMLVIFYLYFAGVILPDPAGDEGTGAHLFQLWLVLEFFAVVFFAFKWIPLQPREAFIILGLQILLALVPLSIVYSLRL